MGDTCESDGAKTETARPVVQRPRRYITRRVSQRLSKQRQPSRGPEQGGGSDGGSGGCRDGLEKKEKASKQPRFSPEQYHMFSTRFEGRVTRTRKEYIECLKIILPLHFNKTSASVRDDTYINTIFYAIRDDIPEEDARPKELWCTNWFFPSAFAHACRLQEVRAADRMRCPSVQRKQIGTKISSF